MKKTFILMAAGLLALAACNKTDNPSKETPAIRITPVLTKAGETSFDSGDAIGVTITRTSGVYAANQKMVYSGSEFSSDLYWYAEGTDGATISAYYPYSATVPTSFSVQEDQSAGTSASDFIAGTKTGVLPSAYAVTLPFRHQLTRLVLKVTNNAEGEPVSISLGGGRLTALVGADYSATVDETAAAGTVKAYKQDASTYVVILPPQKVALTASVETAGGNILAQNLQETDLVAGKQYSINMIVNPKDLVVAFAGEIEDWENGGEIGGGDNTLIEQLDKGYIIYHEQKYTVAKMKDGKWWMTQNLRYVPEGITVSDQLTNVTAGVYYPIVAVNEAPAFSRDITDINARGYLYQAEVALGLKIGDITSLDQAQAMEGAQGLCPKGWHVPTKADITDLVGKGVNITTNTSAPYYDGANGSIKLLNEDGFNMDAFGAVTISNNTATTGSFMGSLNGYKDKISSGMMIGSTQSGAVTYNTAGDETSGLKNIMFCGFMPMTNKATEAEYTCNGTNVGYRIAGALRCVRNN